MKQFGWVCSITYSCPRCGRPFVSEFERNVHLMSCGAMRMHRKHYKHIDIT